MQKPKLQYLLDQMVLRGILNQHGKLRVTNEFRLREKKMAFIFKPSTDFHAFKDEDFFTDTKFLEHGNNDAIFFRFMFSAHKKKKKENIRCRRNFI